MIPNVIHFIYGLDPTFGGKPFKLFHYLAIKSAYEVNKPEKIYFVYAYEPSSEWFDKIKPYVELVKVTPPSHIFGNKLYHYAHQSDVIRLERLLEYGGIYLDLDTICIKSLAFLLKNDFVMGEEYHLWSESPNEPLEKYYKGLCNAVILSTSDSPFLKRWYESYSTFKSKGKDDFWIEHSVVIPGKLAKSYSNEIKILGEEAFFYPSWDETSLKNLFTEVNEYPAAYLHHLWESVAWPYLENITISSILKEDTTYNKIAKGFLL